MYSGAGGASLCSDLDLCSCFSLLAASGEVRVFFFCWTLAASEVFLATADESGTGGACAWDGSGLFGALKSDLDLLGTAERPLGPFEFTTGAGSWWW